MSAVTRLPKQLTIMTAKATTGVGTPQLVNDFMNIQVSLTSQSNANFTIKIQGSFAAPDACPTFSSAASATNPWFYVNSWDLSDVTTNIPGATGYSATGTDIVKGILVNVDALVWLNMEITARSAGSVNATAVVYTNA